MQLLLAHYHHEVRVSVKVNGLAMGVLQGSSERNLGIEESMSGLVNFGNPNRSGQNHMCQEHIGPMMKSVRRQAFALSPTAQIRPLGWTSRTTFQSECDFLSAMKTAN